MQSVMTNKVEKLIGSIEVLIVGHNAYMRKVIRSLPVDLGVKNVHGSGNGIAGLEAIGAHPPDIVVVDWEMPLLNAADLLRIVRLPGAFPVPDVPIIMLTGHVERWRVLEANRLGVDEFLRKPMSGRALLDRIVAVLSSLRPMARTGYHHRQRPRRAQSEAVTKQPAAAVAPRFRLLTQP